MNRRLAAAVAAFGLVISLTACTASDGGAPVPTSPLPGQVHTPTVEAPRTVPRRRPVKPRSTIAPTPTPTATAPAGGTVVLGRSFPNAATTGVPDGTALTPYTGPCLIQIPNTVIDSKSITACDELRVFAKGLVITNSNIVGKIVIDYTANEGSLTISDSTVYAGSDPQYPNTGIGDAWFTATRVEVYGGTRGIACYAECTVQDSWVHGQLEDSGPFGGTNHESGIRVNTNSHLVHNTISCDAGNYPPDGGCSAAITGYPDFDPVSGNVVENNLISATINAGYCAYGGSTGGKPFSGQTHDITFKNNIWRRGTEPGVGGVPQCGYWGPITSFDVNAPGNVWLNNLFDDGTVVDPAN